MQEITIESLMADNLSDAARQARGNWRQIRDSEGLIASLKCADARKISHAGDVMEIRSVATVGDRTPYGKLFGNPKVRAVVVGSHYAMSEEASLSEEITIPEGCGGLAAARDLLNGDVRSPDNGVHGYISRHVKHHDVIRCACDVAAAISEQISDPNKLVMAVVQNHLNGLTLPVGVYSHRGQSSILAVPQRLLQQEPYDPEAIYKNGIPILDGSDIPEVFVKYLGNTQTYAQKLRAEIPDLMIRQTVQNPPAVVISTEVKPIGIRYPQTFGLPNTAFQLTAPRDIIPETRLVHFQDTLLQAEYPLNLSVIHHEVGGSFSDTGTVIIETGSMRFSVILARALLSGHEIAQEWINLPGRQIITIETKAGEIQTARVFAKK